jgi:hypothetical protein
MIEACYLCGRLATEITRDGTEWTGYYRFYNAEEEEWISGAICRYCFIKLKGTKAYFVRVKEK